LRTEDPLKRRGKFAIGVLVGLVALTIGALTTHPLKEVVDSSWANAYPTMKEMVANADAVVMGTVVGVDGVEVSPQADNLIYTNYSFRVDKWIVGSGSSTILLHQMGGAVGLREVSVPDDPPFVVGESNVLFLTEYAPGKYNVMGGPTGRLQVQNGTAKVIAGSSLQIKPGSLESVIQVIASVKTAPVP